MLRLRDFVTCRKRYYNQSGVYISALKDCRKIKFRTYKKVPGFISYQLQSNERLHHLPNQSVKTQCLTQSLLS